MSEILRGRNPIVHCNDLSKQHHLMMEWEQVAEDGPPHDKTFTWKLKMGEFEVIAASNSKKSAKNKCAEEMAVKLDAKFPRRGGPSGRGGFRGGYGGGGPPLRPPHPMMGGPPGYFGPPHGFPPPPGYMAQRMPGPPWMMMQNKKRKPDESGEAGGAAAANPAKAAKMINEAQNNPISKLYEYSKKMKWPEPIFETISENVLESRKTHQGYTLKKTEFTVQCTISGKKFTGKSLKKKEAKTEAAAAAWAEVGMGVGQASIDNLLSAAKQS